MRYFAYALMVVALVLAAMSAVCALLANFVIDSLATTGDWVMRVALRVAKAGAAR